MRVKRVQTDPVPVGVADSPRRYGPLVVVCLAFCTGIILDRLVPGWFGMRWQWELLALTAWGVCYWRKRYRGAFGVLVAAIVLLGADWHEDYWDGYRCTEMGRILSASYRPLCLRAVARSHAMRLPVEPGIRRNGHEDPRFLLKLDIHQVRDGRHWRHVSGRAICSVVGSVDHVRCGDRLHLLVQGQRIPQSHNPGEFKRSEYYRNQRILVRLRGVSVGVTVLGRSRTRRLRRFLEDVRRYATDEFRRHLPIPQAALAAAILVGQRDQLSLDRRQAFLLTGTLHLLVVSGFHVGILASGAWLLGRSGLLSRRLMLWLVIGLTVGYAIMTGARPPVARAATLVVVMCVARLYGRPIFASNTIAFAALVLLVRNPSCLFDPGAQLSFMAVLALMQGVNLSQDRPAENRLEQLLQRSRPWWRRAADRLWRQMYQLCWISLLVWVATAPLVLHHFHVVSCSSVLLNLVLYIPMVIVMFSGLGVWGLGWIPGLALGFAKVCAASLVFIEGVAQSVQDIPGSHCWGPGLPGGWLVLLYSVAVLGFCCLKRLCIAYRCLLVALWLVVGGVVFPLVYGPLFCREPGLRCTFIAVGHGTSVLLEMPNGQNWLYDAGALGDPATVGRRISELLWSRGIKRIDRLLVSHADADHYNAVPYLLDRFDIKSISFPTLMGKQLAKDCADLQRSILLNDCRRLPLQSGDAWQLAGGVRVQVLHPPVDGVAGTDNANSLVLLVEYQAERILLPGDLEGVGLEQLLASKPISCSVLMAPHHGSFHSAPKRIAQWCQPQRVVISSGDKSGRRQVVRDYRTKAEEVWSTTEHGAITIVMDAAGTRVVPWCREPRRYDR